MSTNSLEHSAEEYFIQLLKTSPSLKGKHIVHLDEDRPAVSDCIVVEAQQGNHRLDGPKGYDVEVTVTYRSPSNVSPRQNDMVAQAINETVFQTRPKRTSVEKDFGYLLLLDEVSSNRDNTKSLRSREQKFNLIARLKSQTENALSR